jgi:hypothetical protein
MLGPAAFASPLDLDDPRPRWIEVRFEISPADQPGGLDHLWSRPLPAYLETGADSGLVAIRVPARAIEAHLRETGTDVVPGSFSEFIWKLDPDTGHVVRAQLTGTVREAISLGLLRTTAAVDIRVEMTTHRIGGYQPAKRFLGKQTNGFCTDPGESSRCTLVPAFPLDPQSGYVNAIGSVRAEIPAVRFQAFSPLGEARFSEKPGPAAGTVLSGASELDLGSHGASQRDAVCSVSFGGSC